MEDRGEVLYELSPKFDFFYELTMPTGKKMRSSFIGAIILIIMNIVSAILKAKLANSSNTTIDTVFNVITVILIVLLIFVLLMFIVRIVLQSLEYKGIKYTFYKNCLVYENKFLSQTKKTIEYTNIREVEIRRTIIDRMLNYGVIIIYTNAEKGYGSATIIYAIKDIERHYNNIESIIHSGNVISSPIQTGDSKKDYKAEIDLQNAMNRTETYTETAAVSDINPVSSQESKQITFDDMNNSNSNDEN